jgi:hypothetical protein
MGNVAGMLVVAGEAVVASGRLPRDGGLGLGKESRRQDIRPVKFAQILRESGEFRRLVALGASRSLQWGPSVGLVNWPALRDFEFYSGANPMASVICAGPAMEFAIPGR